MIIHTTYIFSVVWHAQPSMFTAPISVAHTKYHDEYSLVWIKIPIMKGFHLNDTEYNLYGGFEKPLRG